MSAISSYQKKQNFETINDVPIEIDPCSRCAVKSQKTRVFLLEDHAPTREVFRLAIEQVDDIVWAGEAASLAEAREQLPYLKVDVWLVDIQLPDGSGIDFIRERMQEDPEAQMMVATVFGDDARIYAAIEAGAIGYVLKESDPQALVTAVRELVGGGAPMSASIARRVLARLQGMRAKGALLGAMRAPSSPLSRGLESNHANVPSTDEGEASQSILTDREIEVLQFLAQGFRDKEIASRLDISPWTVASHVRHIYRKLHVNNRLAALHQANVMGLI